MHGTIKKGVNSCVYPKEIKRKKNKREREDNLNPYMCVIIYIF